MKPFCYVSGPYRAFTINGVAENIAEARRVAAQCWRLGYTTFTPHLNTAMMDGICDDQNFLDGDLEILKAMAATPQGCIMVMCSNWLSSAGACIEVEMAKELGINIFKSIDEFINWCGDEFVNELIEVLP